MLRFDHTKSLHSLCAALVLAGLTTIPAARALPAIPASAGDILTFVEAEYDYVGLNGPVSSVVSPDNKHVYVAASIENTVLVFSRNAGTGVLTFVEMYRDEVGGVDGLDGVYSVAISPDGEHIYAASYDDDAVAVFGRDDISGTLAYVEVQQDGVGDVDGLDGAESVTVSPDGNHVYVASGVDNAVAVFSRSAITGGLSFVEMQQDGVGDVDGLEGANSVAVSSDGNHVYVASDLDDAVAVFSRSAITGGLSFVEMHQDGAGGVYGLNSAKSVAVSPDGDHVYVAGAVYDAVVVFSRNESSGALTYVEMQRDGVGGVDGLDVAYSVTVSPDGSHVYATGSLDNAVVVFSRNEFTGALTFVEMQQDGVGGVDGLETARSVTVSPDGNHVYVLGHTDDAIVAFSRNGTTGALTFADIRMHAHPNRDGLDGARSAAVSPDGGYVYVASREDDALVVFGCDAASGEMNLVDMLRDGVSLVDGLDGANSVAVSPDGNHVYVASVYDDSVAAFNWDMATEILSFVEVITDGMPLVDGLDFATSVAISPDGNHVYVTAALDNAITAFRRYTTTGQLAYIEDIQDGDDDFVDGLAGAYSVAISPDGYHVYVAGGQDDAVAGFVRNSDTGELAFIQVISDTGSVVNGLDTARSVAVSPDGEQVYVASLDADTLTVYDRDINTGMLTFVEIHQDGYGGVNGLGGAHAVAVSPDGLHVYGAGASDNALAVFSRDVHSGTLTLEEEPRDNVGGVHGLEYPVSIAVSPSGSHVYVTSYHDDAVVAFRRNLYVYLPLVMRNL